jgi:hypothetical protein
MPLLLPFYSGMGHIHGRIGFNESRLDGAFPGNPLMKDALSER